MTIRGERAGAEVIAHVTGNREPFADRNDAENVHLFVGIMADYLLSQVKLFQVKKSIDLAKCFTALVILRLFTMAGNIITCM